MKKKIISISIIILILLNSLIIIAAAEIEISDKCNDNSDDEGWYYLPSYPNYAPNGLPDFSQLQQKDWNSSGGGASLCGAVSLANILWWFDSKNSNQDGTPGDGVDGYPLVSILHPDGSCNPGPNNDDHNFNNVNDINTSWKGKRKSGELIEQIGYYTNRQKDNWFFHKFSGFFKGLFNAFRLYTGTIRWLRDTGLLKNYRIRSVFRPDFELIFNSIKQNKGVILGLAASDFGHFVAVAGANSSGYIAFSDPFFDIANSTTNYTLHNNPNYVSHDIYRVEFDTPSPLLSSFWLPGYGLDCPAIVEGAIIISEKS